MLYFFVGLDVDIRFNEIMEIKLNEERLKIENTDKTWHTGSVLDTLLGGIATPYWKLKMADFSVSYERRRWPRASRQIE